MSSDDLFDDTEDYDDAFLEELDAIQAHSQVARPVATQPQASTSRAKSPASDFSFEDMTFDFDEEELEKAELAASQSVANRPIASSSKTRQTTLFGDVLQPPPAPDKQAAPRRAAGQQAPKVRRWDHTEFAKSGIRKSKAKAKEKDGDQHEDEPDEFEQFPAPFVQRIWPPPMVLRPDLLEAKHWIYPLNQPKRDYQYNIVKHSLFENTIVALPTGLGKTFVAGVVMLNYYRWFPEGKVVFVAPSKPLVAQQIEASHKTCGIPGTDAIELTGNNAVPMRKRAWLEKRIFYMTPQTFINDLVSGTCDASSVILIVVDEAHRATGDYAYTQIVRFMMAKNPHFRILALTATPGSNPEAVQNLIDGLHISRIEIRDENSLDLRAYIHEKKIEQHVIKMSDDVAIIRDLLAKLMDPHINKLRASGLAFGGTAATIHPYSFQGRVKTLGPGQRWAYGTLSLMASLARVMGYLIEGTVKMCHKALQDLPDDGKPASSGGEKKKTLTSQLRSNPQYQAVMKELERLNAQGFPTHPKMDRLKSLILDHLAQRLPDDPDEEPQGSTKIMVFATNRPAVEEIVEYLNLESPMIRAHRFIGQGADKSGKKGLLQREQLEVIQKFKDDEFNVLVATSIGEEGLDIGEIDLIVCYDAQKTPIRMLQRLGRTGRKRAGVVHVLLAEGREEFNMDKAKDTYKQVQKSIVSGNHLELYEDVDRLLPDHIHPECLEKRMEIVEYVRQDSKKRASKDASERPAKKQKKNADASRNIPPTAVDGFVAASKLVPKKAKKPKKPVVPRRDLDIAGVDDDIDRELEEGLSAPRRAQSETTAKSKGKGKAKAKGPPRKSKTIAAETEQEKKKRPQRDRTEVTASQGVDDSDDMAIERGLSPSPPPRPRASGSTRRQPSSREPDDEVIDLTDSDHEDDEDRDDDMQGLGTSMSPQVGALSRGADFDMSWLIENDDDDHVGVNIASSSPVSATFVRHSSVSSSSMMPPPKLPVGFVSARTLDVDTSILEISDSSDVEVNSAQASVSSPKNVSSPSEGSPFPGPSTYPVRHVGAGRKRKIVDPIPSDPASQASSPLRLRRVRKKKKREEEPARRVTVEGVWDDAAQHSGDETSEGGSDEDDSENESDREFLRERPETQVSPSYAQTQMYRQSLMTQAPSASRGPLFARGPERRGRFGRGSLRMPARGAQVSSSPQRPDDELDEYEFDSFLVADDSIVYEDEE